MCVVVYCFDAVEVCVDVNCLDAFKFTWVGAVMNDLRLEPCVWFWEVRGLAPQGCCWLTYTYCVLYSGLYYCDSLATEFGTLTLGLLNLVGCISWLLDLCICCCFSWLSALAYKAALVCLWTSVSLGCGSALFWA